MWVSWNLTLQMQMIRTETGQRGLLYQYLHSIMLKLRRSLITGFWAQVRRILRLNSWFTGDARVQPMQLGSRQKNYGSLMLRSRVILKQSRWGHRFQVVRVVCLTHKLLDLTTCRHVKDLGIGLDMDDGKIVQHKFKVLGCWQGILNVHGLRAG